MKIHKRKIKNPSHAARLKKTANAWKKFTLAYIFTFGMYRGQTLQAAIEQDPLYVNWLVTSNIIFIDEKANIYLQVKITEHNESIHEKREREERRREREHREYEQYNYSNKNGHNTRFFNDFFKNYRNGKENAAVLNEDRLHPAYRFDNLPKRQRYGKILRLTGKVTREDIKSQYRKLALTFHPDKCGTLDEVLQETARIMFLQVQKAYEYFQQGYDL